MREVKSRVCAFAFLLPAFHALAAPPTPSMPSIHDLRELSLEELANIEVTSVSKKPERLADAAASIYIITNEDIRRSGVTSLAEALRLAPNLEVARRDSSQYAISARGFASTAGNKLLVLIDGRVVYTPLFSGVFWDAQDVLLEDIERIEVISGPGATAWGSNAMAGVINVITRAAKDTLGAMVVAGGGNRESGASARYGGRIGDSGGYRVYGKYSDRDSTALANGTSAHDRWKGGQAGFRTDWNGAAGSYVVQGDAYRMSSEQTVPGERTATGQNVLARAIRKLDDSTVQLQAYYDRTVREQPGSFGETLDIVDVELQQGWHAGAAHAITWGAAYREARDRVRNTAQLAFLPADRSLRWASIFAQDEVALREDLHLEAGLRLEHNVYTGMESMPSLRLEWKRPDASLLWASLSRSVRSPSRVDRDLFAPAQAPFILAGGPNFRSEIAKVAELGYRAQPSHSTSFSVTAFHSIYDHIRSVEPGPAGAFVIGNDISGTSSGIEAWGTYQATENWRLKTGGVALRQRLHVGSASPPGSNAAAEGNDPTSHWSIHSMHDLAPGHELDLELRRVGALPDPAVPAYTALNVRYGWQVTRQLEISLSGENLLDRRHVEFGPASSRSEIERAFFAKAQWKF
jgi:iron complex outermembrane receptor protein